MSANTQRCLVERFTVTAVLCPDQPEEIDPVIIFPPGEGDDECECDSPYDPQIPPVLLPDAWTCFEESRKKRFIIAGPHVLHYYGSTDALCVQVGVNRIVNCLVECGIEEYSYCWPQGCPVSVLPPGTYDIYVPAQSAFPLDVGTSVEVTVMLEPITDTYIAALSTMATGSSGCCPC